ncbi:type I secretion system permease/ATPase [Pseudovibrio sp. Tun.PSC04-5.I4]|uniref:type I secretion system permease/ATPase n=1 Tax=Pseudovibrio sp. Tun.PSC04-5.I4 TaxID=1798213 RepID=UPI0008809F63|nr:type I secretion system permease/ATPase [Pseudovibrio sp. Tun.PSC04-5.I4]SDR33836.1 ATP-binding cassette, subfamily C [Pseudovibrio sp. Tun.PSC04-5.I4]
MFKFRLANKRSDQKSRQITRVLLAKDALQGRLKGEWFTKQIGRFTPKKNDGPNEDIDFRRLMQNGLGQAKLNLMFVGFFSFCASLLILSVPIYLFQISDRVLTSRSIDTLVMLTTIVIGLVLAHVLLDMFRRFMLMRVAVDVETRLGGPVLSAAARASHNGSSQEFQALSDLQQLRSFLTGSVLLTMMDAPVAPIYLLVVYLVHPHLGLIVTTTILLLLVLARVNQKLTAIPFAKANAFSSRANLQAEAMARNAQVMNAMGMIPEGVIIWGKETAESLKAQIIGQDRNVLISAASKFIRLSTQITMLGWGAWLALSNEITGGMIIAASIIGGRALAPVEGIIDGWKSYVGAKSAYARIYKLLHTSPLNVHRLRLPNPIGRLSVERLLYVPPPNKRVILNGVSFQLTPGDSLAVVGASGSGKSTLGKMLVGSLIPTAGNVRLDMMDLRNWDSRQLGENIGYLPQDVQLFPGSIKENIARMNKEAKDDDVFKAAQMADIHEMVSQFSQGYETQVAMDGAPLSGGQRQRIGLARAFYNSPRLLVLDEPNSNLDTTGEIALAQALEHAKQDGMTVIAITQRPALLRCVDKIMMLKDGTVSAFGSRDEVMPLITGKRPELTRRPTVAGQNMPVAQPAE